MEYILKNGKELIVRKPNISDAKELISIVKQADRETMFMSRNEGEFVISEELEEKIISDRLYDPNNDMFVAEYEGRCIGQCSVGSAKKGQRCKHRANFSLFVLKDYWGLGIAGKMMCECINWCIERKMTQIELDVVKDNERAVKLFHDFGFFSVGEMPNTFRYKDGTYANAYIMVKMIEINQ